MSEESLGRISPPVENSSATRDEGDDETEVVGQPNMVSGEQSFSTNGRRARNWSPGGSVWSALTAVMKSASLYHKA